MTMWFSPRHLFSTPRTSAAAPPPKPLRLPTKPPRGRYRVLFVGGEAAVLDVHDGDTFRMVLVLDPEGGTGIWPWLRLDGCDAAELNKPGGPAAQQWAVDFLGGARLIEVELGGWSFDRRVARVWVNGEDMTQAMISAGHAVAWARTRPK